MTQLEHRLLLDHKEHQSPGFSIDICFVQMVEEYVMLYRVECFLQVVEALKYLGTTVNIGFFTS